VNGLAERIARVHATIAQAAERAGRSPTDIALVAVSKTHPASAVLEAVQAGLRQFGENRVEEAAAKIAEVAKATDAALTWHMIGHIQSRKARDVAPLFAVVQSVDSLRLAVKLAQAIPDGHRIEVLLECNVSGEMSKAGFAAHDWEANQAALDALANDLRAVAQLPGLDVRGLMTMAPIVDDMEAVRPVFRSLRRLRDALQNQVGLPLPELSMGMTDDFSVAVEEGATIVRVGRAIFGERTS